MLQILDGDNDARVKLLQLIPLFVHCFITNLLDSKDLWNRFAKEVFSVCLSLLYDGVITIRNTAEATLRNVRNYAEY